MCLTEKEIAIQQARSDYLVDAIRNQLPPSSLWHEKLFALSQIENLAITTNSGSLDIVTFDMSHDSYRPDASILEFGNLGIFVSHLSANLPLHSDELQRQFVTANSRFDGFASDQLHDVINHYRRLTCRIEFRSPDGAVDSHGKRLCSSVAKLLNLPVQYEPFDFAKANDLDVYEGTEWLEGAARSADFPFEKPLSELSVRDRLSRLNLDGESLRNIYASCPQNPEIYSLNFVARRF